MVKLIEGYGTVLGSIAYTDMHGTASTSRGRWVILDAQGDHVTSLVEDEDRERDRRTFTPGRAVTTADVLALARKIYPHATHVHDADQMMDAGVIPADGTMGYVILESR